MLGGENTSANYAVAWQEAKPKSVYALQPVE